ncbi:type II toxin-antitoxin system HipA family toxin [Pseudoalteromonas rubra]|nr:HipA domain-containing protein [Pseudoalteromonas rubra]
MSKLLYISLSVDFMMEEVTLQAFVAAQWHDIAIISFPQSSEGNYQLTELSYLDDYILAHLEKDDFHAASLNYPVSFFFDDSDESGWLAFLDDIVPSGASRRFWAKFLDIEDLRPDEQNFILLKHGTMSPVGNLRIKESLPDREEVADTLYFSFDDVKNRASDFLDYAQQRGAAAGGATGAGGEAPKLLLRCSMEQDVNRRRIWIDPYQDDNADQDLHYLVKYPRGAKAEIDCNILRAEFHYYHELTSMGINTIPIKHMRLEEGISYPSLWLPRFDIWTDEHQCRNRFAMESVYSILGKRPGTTLYHEETIRALIHKINNSHMVTEQGYQFDSQRFVIEWVKRDLLNIIFGNSDNHGRNTSFLKGDGFIELAPIYDFAPMKADPEGIPRTTKWYQPLEVGGTYDFIGIAESLCDLVPPDMLLSVLRDIAHQCLDLKQRLADRGVPEQILTMPSIGFDHIPNKFSKWGLI